MNPEYYLRKLTSGLDGYIKAKVDERMQEREAAFQLTVTRASRHIADETAKLNKIAHQLDKYIDASGNLKDGKIVGPE